MKLKLEKAIVCCSCSFAWGRKSRPENYRVLNHIFTFLSYGRLKFYHLLLIHVLSHLVGLMLQVINMDKMFDTHIIIVLINEGVCV